MSRGFAAFHCLQTQLQLDDPLLFVVWTELASVSCHLLGAVNLEQTSEFSYFSLELLVRLLLPNQFVAAALVRTLSRGIGPHFALLALVPLASVVLRLRLARICARSSGA